MSGLAPDNIVVLQNNYADNLIISGNGPFIFPTPIQDSNTYYIGVLIQPSRPNQQCQVEGRYGAVVDRDIGDVRIECTNNSYKVGGTVTGLAGGNSVVLRNNDGDDLTVSNNGPFVFATALPDGSDFSISVASQPTSPNQTCVVTKPTGTLAGGDATTVVVTCTNVTYSIGGTVQHLGPTNTVILQNNGGDDLAVSADGTFTFATRIPDGTSYDVRVLAQPTNPNETCEVEYGSGSVLGADITSVKIFCVGFSAIAAGGGHLCVVRHDGTVACWGLNTVGQATPPTGSSYYGIVAGYQHTCALKTTGFSLNCWGWNNYGQSTPPTDTDFVSVGAGMKHNCAVRADHSVACWGKNDFGQATAPAGTNFAAVDGGESHTCALRTDGSVYCWGKNDVSQTNEPSGTNFVSITSGETHNCALRSTGAVSCWGGNFYGQATSPAGTNFVAVAAGYDHNCAVMLDGTLTCWGRNYMDSATPPTGPDYETDLDAITGGLNFTVVRRLDGYLEYWGDFVP